MKHNHIANVTCGVSVSRASQVLSMICSQCTTTQYFWYSCCIYITTGPDLICEWPAPTKQLTKLRSFGIHDYTKNDVAIVHTIVKEFPCHDVHHKEGIFFRMCTLTHTYVFAYRWMYIVKSFSFYLFKLKYDSTSCKYKLLYPICKVFTHLLGW